MFYYIFGSFIIFLAFTFLGIAAWNHDSLFLPLALFFAMIVSGTLCITQPAFVEHKKNNNLKNYWREATGLNIANYWNGAITIHCFANNADVTLNLTTTNWMGKEQLLYFDTTTAKYYELNLANYHQWYPYDCKAR